MELNIEEILQSEQAWEYILLDIVKSADLDPWDIDLTKLTESYLEKIETMKRLDLRVPARIILAAAILLKLQADTIVPSEAGGFFDFDFDEADELFSDQEDREAEEVPMLDLHIRRRPTRKVTLDDLVKSLKKSFQSEVRRERKRRRVHFQIDVEGIDISEQIDKIYGEITSHKEKKIPFSNLLEDKDRDTVINTLMPLLHLANDHKIGLEQEEFFKEFYVLKRPTPNT